MYSNFAQFLSDYQLYSKFEILDCHSQSDIFETTFKFYCEKDCDTTTFEIKKEYKSVMDTSESGLSIAKKNVISNSTFDFSFHKHYVAVCQHCKTYEVNYLINGSTTRDKDGNKKLYLRKVGQNPAPVVMPEKELYNFLNSEDRDFYTKALKNLKYGHGIGAYAYLRRVIENEIYRIVEKISELESPEKTKISEVLETYEDNHQMSNLIDAITPYLPQSLKQEHSENILRLLYNQSSVALHELSEEQCLEKAESIDRLFLYCIKKLNEEKNDASDIKRAINSLK